MEVREPPKGSPGKPAGAPPPAPVDFDTWVRRRRAQVRRRLLDAAAACSRRTVRTRPRDPVEDDLLTHLVVLRWKRALATGEVQRLGTRRWRLRV